jgi:hypothetical protein
MHGQGHPTVHGRVCAGGRIPSRWTGRRHRSAKTQSPASSSATSVSVCVGAATEMRTLSSCTPTAIKRAAASASSAAARGSSRSRRRRPHAGGRSFLRPTRARGRSRLGAAELMVGSARPTRARELLDGGARNPRTNARSRAVTRGRATRDAARPDDHRPVAARTHARRGAPTLSTLRRPRVILPFDFDHSNRSLPDRHALSATVRRSACATPRARRCPRGRNRAVAAGSCARAPLRPRDVGYSGSRSGHLAMR